MKTLALIAPLLIAAGSASALESMHQPLYLEGGLNYLSSAAREATSAHGIHVGFGYVSDDTALLLQSGFGGVDFDWRHAARDSNRLDTVSVCYSERFYGVAGDLYIGYGVGSAFNRLERHTPTINSTDKDWRIALKAMVGYVIGGGLILEAGYHYTGKVGDLQSSGATLDVGLWF
jgi:hypothetical protein